jgi:sugar lactone lactonase YvrE
VPKLDEFVIPQTLPTQPKTKDNRFTKLVVLILILLGLLLAYWLITRPPESKDTKPTRGITNLFSIYGINRQDFLVSPNAVYIHDNGDIYIADTGNNRIVVFNSRGRYKSKIEYKKNKKSKLPTPGDLLTPLGVTVDYQGQVITASLDSGVIIFNKNGKKVKQLPIPAIQVYTHDKRVYILSTGSVYAINTHGEIVQHIGSQGRLPGQFESPQDLLINSKDQIVISDSQNMRLQIFDKRGRIIAFKGSPPKALDDANRLFGLGCGITQDEAGNIYVADAFHHAIRIFNKDGNDLGEVGAQGEVDGLFNYPSDITFISANIFAIADKWNDRVQIVRLDLGAAKGGETKAKSKPTIPIWALIIGILILLAIIIAVARHFMRSRRQQGHQARL